MTAEQYVLDPQGALIAGYPWLDVWSRDVVLALPGIHLARGNISAARDCLSYLCSHVDDGFLPQRLPYSVSGTVRSPAAPEPALDATLWLFEAARLFAAQVGRQDPFLMDVVYPVLRSVFEHLTNGASEHAWLTPEGLVENGGAGALTWMDARTNAHLVTPRKGLAVEVQALWSRACDTLASMARDALDPELEAAAAAARDAVRRHFGSRFWCNETDYPFDCISGTRHAGDVWADPSVRPNALIALAVDPELFEPWQRKALLERCERELLTPHGLRSLAPTEANYVGHVGGTVAERRASYHQGPAWPYLLGFYVRAALLSAGDDPIVVTRLRDLVEGAAESGPVLGHIAQAADGEPPHRWRGCPAQACSVAVLLDLLVNVLPPRPRVSEPASDYADVSDW